MSEWTTVLDLLRQLADAPDGKIGIVSDGGRNDESSLVGTRDGYLHFALRILETIERVDAGRAERIDGVPWSNAPAQAVYRLPSLDECGLVGAYVHPSHGEAIAAMQRFLDGVLPDGSRLDADPAFAVPSGETERSQPKALSTERGMLVFFCGKMGAGKSTHAARLTEERGAVLISEDDWLSALYPDQITTFDDYLRLSARLKPVVAAHVASLLTIGTDVVMDFPANTAKQRAWFRSIVHDADAPHELVYLRASDALCLRQIEQRSREQPERAAFDTPAVFEHVTRFFEEPDPDEGFELRVIERDA